MFIRLVYSNSTAPTCEYLINQSFPVVDSDCSSYTCVPSVINTGCKVRLSMKNIQLENSLSLRIPTLKLIGQLYLHLQVPMVQVLANL
jgi:hypothetical protein